MGKRDLRPVWFNFGDLGYPEWVPMSRLEMQVIWEGAQDMMASHSPEAIAEAMCITRARLMLAAISGRVDPDWCSRALLCTAIDCYQQGQLPDYRLDEAD